MGLHDDTCEVCGGIGIQHNYHPDPDEDRIRAEQIALVELRIAMQTLALNLRWAGALCAAWDIGRYCIDRDPFSEMRMGMNSWRPGCGVRAPGWGGK